MIGRAHQRGANDLNASRASRQSATTRSGDQPRGQTHRGLTGRALAGFATGGKTYGSTTIVEASPPDPTHPRKLRAIHLGESKVVLRIFEMFASGGSPKKIAATLNVAGIPAPTMVEGKQAKSRVGSPNHPPHVPKRELRGRLVWE